MIRIHQQHHREHPNIHGKNLNEIQNMMRIAIMIIIIIINAHINAHHVVAVKVVMLAKILAVVVGNIHAEALAEVDVIDQEIVPKTDLDVPIMIISLPETINHLDEIEIIKVRESIGPGQGPDQDRDGFKQNIIKIKNYRFYSAVL